jgi:endonuclease YncB( thermonuclease family)
MKKPTKQELEKIQKESKAYNLMLMIWIALLLFIAISELSAQTGIVYKVTDGDTFRIKTKDTIFIARLYAIDCPEKKQQFGEDAKRFVTDLILNKEVNYTIKSIDKRYKRLVIDCKVENSSLSELLLINGLAWHYCAYDKSEVLHSLQNIAKSNKFGLWSGENPVEPWIYRKNKKRK